MKSKQLFLGFLLSSMLLSCAQDTPVQAGKVHADNETFTFTVTVENTSNNTSLSSGFSPLVWDINTDTARLFEAQKPASEALERLAEDGNQELLEKIVTGHLESPLQPGEKASFTFSTMPGNKLTVASMMIESNDVFIGTESPVALFDSRNEPFSGKVTLALYDAGTEVNQEPGKGDQQAPRQSEVNTGTVESEAVQLLSQRQDGFTYPEASALYTLTVSVSDDHDHDHDHDEEGHDDHNEESHDDHHEDGHE